MRAAEGALVCVPRHNMSLEADGSHGLVVAVVALERFLAVVLDDHVVPEALLPHRPVITLRTGEWFDAGMFGSHMSIQIIRSHSLEVAEAAGKWLVVRVPRHDVRLEIPGLVRSVLTVRASKLFLRVHIGRIRFLWQSSKCPLA